LKEGANSDGLPGFWPRALSENSIAWKGKLQHQQLTTPDNSKRKNRRR
jgi:hypothetical protein